MQNAGNAEIAITEWPSLYDLDNPRTVLLTWDALVQRFSTHRRYAQKETAPGFGPYLLAPPPEPCLKHSGPPKSQIHRCDTCVKYMSLLVFDVDIGSREDVSNCNKALVRDSVALFWYSTFSHTPGRPSYRLLLPISRPVLPEEWKEFRASVLSRYKIPADPKKCSGRSHFYFEPSRPAALDAPDTETFAAPGNPIPVDQHVLYSRRSVSLGTLDGFSFTPPADPPHDGPISVEAERAVLRALLARLSRSNSRGSDEYKAGLVRKCLAGAPLAEHLDRNHAALVLTGMLAYALPKSPVAVLRFLLRPSIEGMIAAGSKLTWEKVERMLLSAMRNKAEADHLRDSSRQKRKEALNQFHQRLLAERDAWAEKGHA